MKTPRKQFNEVPLPANWTPPPKGWLFIGMDQDLPRQDGKFMIGQPSIGFDYIGEHLKSDPQYGIAIAAPAELCNRLHAAPESQRVITAPPKPAEPVKGRFIITGIALANCTFDTAEEAYEAANQAVKHKPDSTVYVYQLRAKFTASVNVNRTDY